MAKGLKTRGFSAVGLKFLLIGIFIFIAITRLLIVGGVGFGKRPKNQVFFPRWIKIFIDRDIYIYCYHRIIDIPHRPVHALAGLQKKNTRITNAKKNIVYNFYFMFCCVINNNNKKKTCIHIPLSNIYFIYCMMIINIFFVISIVIDSDRGHCYKHLKRKKNYHENWARDIYLNVCVCDEFLSPRNSKKLSFELFRPNLHKLGLFVISSIFHM